MHYNLLHQQLSFEKAIINNSKSTGKCNNGTTSSKLSRFLSAIHTESGCIIKRPWLLVVAEDWWKVKILGFARRALSKTETRYCSTKLRFLAQKWLVCNQFRNYLLYAPKIDAYTDNNPLPYVLSTTTE